MEGVWAFDFRDGLFGDDCGTVVFVGAADEFPIAVAEAEVAVGSSSAVVLLEQGGAAFGIGFAEQGGEDVFAIAALAFGDLCAGEGGEGGGEIDGADDLPRRCRRGFSRAMR